jgi:malonate-semialdehyde dehydrogenase (acetylating)/methylmalonate-semialdehyde dehydrogenase
MPVTRLQNYIDGAWVDSSASSTYPVTNPATGTVIGECPLSGADELDAAVRSARKAFESWRRVPAQERVQYLFRFKTLMEEHAEELAAIVTRENGKTLSEAMGSVRRGIQMIDTATGAPSLMMGQALEDISSGIDCESIRQPMGVFACIAPFNFPAMVPLWFFPFAVACGNTFVCKPSEQVPFSQKLVWELIHEAGFPAGVLNLVNGGREVVESMCSHPDIAGVSFVGSSPVAEKVYAAAATNRKRVQALGGAKNFIIVMPDADMVLTTDNLCESAFGCAGERCLAASVILTVGEAHGPVRAGLIEHMNKVVVGDGSKPGVTMGPVINAGAKQRILDFIASGVADGAELVVDGREATVPDEGYFLGPTLFDGVTQDMKIATEEIFGPVLCIQKVASLDEALAITKAQPLANANSIFTQSGKSARKFRYEVDASMAGVNIGVAAPMSFFSFGGAKGSFLGDLKAHGREAFDFFTDRKVFITRW